MVCNCVGSTVNSYRREAVLPAVVDSASDVFVESCQLFDSEVDELESSPVPLVCVDPACSP